MRGRKPPFFSTRGEKDGETSELAFPGWFWNSFQRFAVEVVVGSLRLQIGGYAETPNQLWEKICGPTPANGNKILFSLFFLQPQPYSSYFGGGGQASSSSGYGGGNFNLGYHSSGGSASNPPPPPPPPMQPVNVNPYLPNKASGALIESLYDGTAGRYSVHVRSTQQVI